MIDRGVKGSKKNGHRLKESGRKFIKSYYRLEEEEIERKGYKKKESKRCSKYVLLLEKEKDVVNTH